MFKLDWYITKVIAIWTSVVLVILISFRSINVLVDELGYLGRADYQMLEIIYVVLLRTPGFMYEVFPISLLLGGLMALGGLARNREIIALRAAGVSIWRLFRSLVKSGIILVLVGLFIGEVVAPGMLQQSEQLRAKWLKYPSILQTKYGIWLRDANTFVNIRRIRPDGELRNITTYHFSEDGSLGLMRNALRAEYSVSKGWILRNVRETRFEDPKVYSRTVSEVPMEAHLDSDMMTKLGVDPQILSIIDLYEYNSFLRRNEQSVPEYEVAFWSKLAIPALSILMLILAMPFALSTLRDTDIPRRLMMGAIVGVVVFLINKSANFIGIIYNVSPIALAWGPVFILAGALVLYLRRIALR